MKERVTSDKTTRACFLLLGTGLKHFMQGDAPNLLILHGAGIYLISSCNESEYDSTRYCLNYKCYKSKLPDEL